MLTDRIHISITKRSLAGKLSLGSSFLMSTLEWSLVVSIIQTGSSHLVGLLPDIFRPGRIFFLFSIK